MKDEIISLAKKLISIPSTVDNISALQKVLEIAEENIDAPFLQKFSQNDNPSLFAANRKDFSEKFRLVLNAHIDVVPGREDQYTPVIKDEKLFGRGAADMKSAAAVIILVFNQLVNKVNFPLGLQITTDEETGGHNGTKFQLEKGLKTDFAISGELTNLSINLKAKGIIQLSILSSGKTAHSAYPWNGENALWKLVDILHSLKEKFPVPQKEAWETSINLAKIETSNLTNNKIPNDALAKLDIRFTPEQSSAVRDELEKIKNKGFEIIISEDEPAQFSEKEDKSVKALASSIKNKTGKETDFILKHGASDIRHFNVFGFPGVVFGPIGEGLHSDNEWVNIESLTTYFEILEDFILSLNEK